MALEQGEQENRDTDHAELPGQQEGAGRQGGEDFEGKCYVFDGRVAVDVNTVNPKVISTCHVCGTLSDHMVNCANPVCNIHVPICDACGVSLEGACSESCKAHPEKRAYDGTGFYAKTMNGYDPYLFAKRQKSDV